MVLQSSKENDLIALGLFHREEFWILKFDVVIRKALRPQNVKKPLDPSISERNRVCISPAYNPTCSDFSGHDDVKYQFLVDNVGRGNKRLHFAPSKAMLADIFMKNLKKAKFRLLLELTNMA